MVNTSATSESSLRGKNAYVLLQVAISNPRHLRARPACLYGEHIGQVSEQ